MNVNISEIYRYKKDGIVILETKTKRITEVHKNVHNKSYEHFYINDIINLGDVYENERYYCI